MYITLINKHILIKNNIIRAILEEYLKNILYKDCATFTYSIIDGKQISYFFSKKIE